MSAICTAWVFSIYKCQSGAGRPEEHLQSSCQQGDWRPGAEDVVIWRAGFCSQSFSCLRGSQLWTSGAMEAEHECDAQRLTSVVSRLNDVPTASRMKLTRPCSGGWEAMGTWLALAIS